MLIRAHVKYQSACDVYRDVARLQVTWEGGFGLVDKKKGISANENTMLCLDLRSKAMTATGLMTLMQVGKLELGKPAKWPVKS